MRRPKEVFILMWVKSIPLSLFPGDTSREKEKVDDMGLAIGLSICLSMSLCSVILLLTSLRLLCQGYLYIAIHPFSYP